MSSYPERIRSSDGGFPSTVSPRDPSARVGTGTAPMQPRRDGEGSLAHVVETLLDKGLVLNADIMVSVAGVELLGIRLRAALASFETAARYGLEFPSGTDTETAAWREATEACRAGGKRAPREQLLNQWRPWCGWRSAQAQARAADDAGPAGVTGGRDAAAAVEEGRATGAAGEPSAGEPVAGEAQRRDG